ncbi:hypothetical protein DVH24_041414 [Malus domestica]|uniref:Uncharacterized protein n=1 Tax=Malus domestica TaxID=3750 RepID=A0A498IE25_MALDO|nr:hypothetical protein DVH24_041414 [Malus domestica]
MCLICTCSPPYSTRPFGNSLAAGSIGTPKLSKFGMGDPLGSSCVSSHKQNLEGVAGAQSGQYRATAESRLGCDKTFG